MNNTSSRPSKLKLHTMENSISCNKSEVDQTSLCFEMCATLKETGSKFSFALKLDSGFNFSLSSGGMPGSSPKAKTKRHRSGSYLRRQARRRAAFLERKKKHLLEEEATTTRQDNSVCVEEAGDVLNKTIASPMQTYAKEDQTVEGDRPLDLNPNHITQKNQLLTTTVRSTWIQFQHGSNGDIRRSPWSQRRRRRCPRRQMAPAAGRSTLLTRDGPKKQPRQTRVVRVTIGSQCPPEEEDRPPLRRMNK